MPGMVATPGTTEHSQEEAFNRVMNNQAIKRRVQPEHLAGLVAFLASDASSYVNATEFLVDGGITSAYVTALDPPDATSGHE